MRDLDARLSALWQQCPQLRMMPAQVVTRTVSVFAYRFAQALHLGEQGVPIEGVQVVVHDCSF